MRALLRGYGRSVRFVSDVVLWLCVAALATAVALNAAEIIGRYFFGSSSLYRVEISLELCTAMYLVGYVVLLARREDVTMDYFHERMPRRVRMALDVATALGTLAFFAVLLDNALVYWRLTSTMTHPTFPISRGSTTFPIVVAAAACCYVSIYQVLAAVDDAIRSKADPAIVSGG
jgi:TRAP-type C4-dicarboxylate transport system permease small subunit